MALSKRDQAQLKALAETDPKIAAELKKLDQIAARLSDSVARAATQKRKDDTREKIVLGAVLMDHMLSVENGEEALHKMLNNKVKKVSDRDFLKSRGWRIQDNESAQIQE